MTNLKHVIGDFFIARVNHPTLTDELKAQFAEARPIGVHFSANAFLQNAPYDEWLDAYSQLRQQILAATDREVFIWSLDHEGGRVHRTPPPITHWPYTFNWQDHSANVGTAIGKELHSLGINLLFGPSLDIFSNPENKVIGPRAFASEAEGVIQHGLAYIQAVEAQGVMCVAKHFPGHGNTLEDSHFELPTLRDDIDALHERELKPFKAAIDANLKALMTAHILFPNISETLPACLAPEFTVELLRNQLNFQGVSITDDLDMKAIADNFPSKALAQLALDSDTDLFIMHHYIDRIILLQQHMQPLTETRDLAPRRQRIERLLTQLPQHAPYMLDDAVLESHQALTQEIGEQFHVEIKQLGDE